MKKNVIIYGLSIFLVLIIIISQVYLLANKKAFIEDYSLGDTGYYLGDVNMNGKVDASDYIAIRKYILKLKDLTGMSALLADVNQSGKIDVQDYIRVRKMILKILPLEKATFLTYTINYYSNGGSGSMASHSCETNDSCTIKSNSFTRGGYRFIGWTTNSNGNNDGFNWTGWSGTWTYSNGEYGITNNNLNLYAMWEKTNSNSYAIIYHSNGGSGNMDSHNCEINKSCTIRNNSFTRSGYRFVGWTTNSSGKDDGYKWTGWSGTWKYSNGEYGINDNTLNLYVMWEKIDPNSYTIIYHSNGGNGSMDSQVCKKNNICTIKSNSFTKSNYHFAGWTTNSNGKDDGYGWTDWSGTWTYSNGEYGITNNTVDLYAMWESRIVRVGIWYSTWYAYKGYDSTDNKVNTWTSWDIKFKPLLSNNTFGYYDTMNSEEVMFQISNIASAGIDFLILDQTNNIFVDESYIFNRAVNTAKVITQYNDSEGGSLYYCSAVGGIQWSNNAKTIEDEARTIWEQFVTQSYGKYHLYYAGKPVLVVYGDGGEELWKNYHGDKTYGNKFSIFYADNNSTPGYWGWAYGTAKPNQNSAVIMPGWHNHYNQQVKRNKGKTYIDNWNTVLKYNPTPEFVIINSFNEYAEATAVWPADTSELTKSKYTDANDFWYGEDGKTLDPYYYWNLTKKYVGMIKAKK